MCFYQNKKLKNVKASFKRLNLIFYTTLLPTCRNQGYVHVCSSGEGPVLCGARRSAGGGGRTPTAALDSHQPPLRPGPLLSLSDKTHRTPRQRQHSRSQAGDTRLRQWGDLGRGQTLSASKPPLAPGPAASAASVTLSAQAARQLRPRGP